MPTYEFRCSNGHVFDQFHKISDAPSTAACPICGLEAARAISGGAGLVFKGSGFYLTDYGKNAHRSGSSAPAKSEGGDSGSKGEGSGSKESASKESGSKGSDGGSGKSGGGASSAGGSTGGGSTASSDKSSASSGGSSSGGASGGGASGNSSGKSGGSA